MSTPAEKFVALLSHRNPRFIDEGKAAKVTALRHEAFAPASAEDLARLTAELQGAGDDLLALYRQVNGALAFAVADDPDLHFFFLPVGEMETAKRELETWLFMLADDPDYEYWEETDPKTGRLYLYGTTDWWPTAVVFGGFGCSPERFYVPTEGPHRGKVFMYEHDGDYSIHVADSIGAMLEDIATAPAAFMRQRSSTGSRKRSPTSALMAGERRPAAAGSLRGRISSTRR